MKRSPWHPLRQAEKPIEARSCFSPGLWARATLLPRPFGELELEDFRFQSPLETLFRPFTANSPQSARQRHPRCDSWLLWCVVPCSDPARKPALRWGSCPEPSYTRYWTTALRPGGWLTSVPPFMETWKPLLGRENERVVFT